MGAADDPGTGLLVELHEDECWRLLGSQPVGRLAATGAEGPTVIPVNYRLVDGQVLLRTATYSKMAQEVEDRLVAFEVDQFDAENHSGRSVMVRGPAHLDLWAHPQRRPRDVARRGAAAAARRHRGVHLG